MIPEQPPLEITARVSDRRSGHSLWRILSLLGIVVALVVSLVQSLPFEPRQSRQFLFAALFVIAILIVSRFLFRRAVEAFIACPDVLVPIGIVLLASTAMDLLLILPLSRDVLAPSWSVSLFGVALSLSLGTVLHMLLWTAFAAWQTDLLWRIVQGKQPADMTPWPSIRRHFLRVFVTLAVGVGVLILCIIPVAAIGGIVLPLALLGMGVIGIVWNLVTAALLPVVVSSTSPLRLAMSEGFKLSWNLKGRWWKQLSAQLLLLGLILCIRVQFTTTEESMDSIQRVRNVNQQTQTNFKWQVNAFWVGGYEHDCRWYSRYAALLETKEVPFIGKSLDILFLVLAVAMKWTVIRTIVDSAGQKGGAHPVRRPGDSEMAGWDDEPAM